MDVLQVAVVEPDLATSRFTKACDDGKDAPTDAAGALFDEGVMALAAELGLKADDYLARADAYSFFKQAA